MTTMLTVYHSVCIFMLTLVCVSTSTTWRKVTRYPGWGLPVEQNSSMKNGHNKEAKSNVYDCIKSCMDRTHCDAVSYSQNTGFCAYQGGKYSYITEAADAELLIIKNITVSYVVRSAGLPSETEADLLCHEIGQHLITEVQLNELRAQNYTICGCGYSVGGMPNIRCQDAPNNACNIRGAFCTTN